MMCVVCRAPVMEQESNIGEGGLLLLLISVEVSF